LIWSRQAAELFAQKEKSCKKPKRHPRLANKPKREPS
jgi:hypothetical protein